MATKTLAFEIGVEEIPAFDLSNAVSQLEKLAPKLFKDAAISHGDIKIYSSPRRLIVIAQDIPEATEAKVEVFRGPNVKIAFDEEGNPTKAAQGFARGKGLTAEDLTVEEVDGVKYVFAKTETPSVRVASLLPSVLEQLIRGINWPKSQRWGSVTEYFSRPIRWIVALFGQEVIDFSFAGLVAGNKTCGHRFLAPGPFEVEDADALIDVISNAYVVPSEDLRGQEIARQIKAIEEEIGLVASLPQKIWNEVVNLSEYPNVLVGKFDEEFLAVPEEIIVDAMLMHQRYFPLYTTEGVLTNNFLVVSNGNPECAATIIDGNERVVRARLYDAKFFYDEDLKKPLEDYVEQLETVVFQEKLGTVLDKTHRIEKIVSLLVKQAQLSEQDAADALRAAHLCKADLVTGAVVEFTSVQGIMGSYYAIAAGETAQVAQIIEQHYKPKFAGDTLPDTTAGKLVALADKLDTICGLFAADSAPTGSSDPFALRRSAIGIVAMLRENLGVELIEAIELALGNFDTIEFNLEEVKKQVIDFFITRTKVILKDEGVSSDVIDAVLASGVLEPEEIINRAYTLQKVRAELPETMEDLAIAFARANNLRQAQAGTDIDESILLEVEKSLNDAVLVAATQVAQAMDANDYEKALKDLAALREPIDAFFAEVMVMDEDEKIRANRLALLNRFVAVFANVADFACMSKK
ncbi:MAG: glycine--tRNA ligase subunit beta [Anaerotardibacter sp.]